MQFIRNFFDTLGFLTRLAPARIIPEETMNRCMRFMPAVGLVLGFIVVLPFWLGLFSGSPWVQAWLMVMLNITLTRGLHFDGLGDVCDAVTTHTDPIRFWVVIKDSHTGAFGVIGLISIIGGEGILFHEMITAGAFTTIIWTFMLGRAACVGLGYMVRHLTRPGLGKLYIDGATLPVALVAGALTTFLGFFLAGFGTTIVGIFFASCALYFLHRLAEHVGGANGDFLGCAVLLGEVAAGLGFALLV
ncbi:adenosylcobinamide-GDP ribazoletransferase [Pseudodesulfovibrio piezophilus]|uniref:Adenosylcobinamide-GDP ribazoletransferase n=1 Tax=Pseudodesulfovibrio piezophilus (strain DSM 21447 / JCM 15486 / C1TLV30) TaxID=1322246 RepID=M1WMW3_PSEP2|nr:adenosylcobinamide-GDP ribazoletransferase [Pseudodesulfovibrio piezophilus]CCH50010.1 Cobalamin synthase [Pseudodesulfovibrio piezophilus C1TLV30]